MNKFEYTHKDLADAIESNLFHEQFYDKAVQSVRQHSEEVGELIEMICLGAEATQENRDKMAGIMEKIELQYDDEFERMVNEALCDNELEVQLQYVE